MEAYELFLKGTYFFKRDYDGTKKALKYFQKATELDTNFSEAFAYIGETYLHLAGYNLMAATDAYVKSRTAANKAIEINEQEPRAHKVLAYIHLFFDWDWETADTEYKKAIKYGLPPQNEFITYLDIFINSDYDRAISVSKKILETDPLHIINHWQLGICYYFAGRFDEALVYFNSALELDSNYSDGHHWKGVVLGYLGKYEEAIASINKSIEITQGNNLAYIDLLAVKIQMGKKDEALEGMKSVDFIDPMDAARLYTMMDMQNEAILWMEKGFRERSVMMASLKHWMWDPIRNNPGFIKIYNKMKFPD